ncbi:MAG: hypothetical protein ACTIJJ_13185 [Galactobacter sp.]
MTEQSAGDELPEGLPETLSEAERELLRPILDLEHHQVPCNDDVTNGVEVTEAEESATVPDLSDHVQAYQSVLDSLTAALDDESVLGDEPDGEPGTAKPGPSRLVTRPRQGEDRA